MSRLHHDGRDRRLDPVKQSGDHGHVTKGDVHPGQGNQDEQRRQHKQHTSDHAAPGPVHQPADVGRQLLSLGPGQQHAVVEGVQKASLGDPAPAFDQFLMHDRNLPGRPAETDETKLEPEQEGFAQADGPGLGHSLLGDRGGRGAQARVPCAGKR
ncbi:hypothetical protein D3C84_483100 [compost metagenome]